MMALVMSDRNVGYFPSYILQRIRRNKNFICAVTGATGSGKSWTALRMGETLDPDFNIDNVCFTPREFLDLINGEVKQLKKGSCIVFDEVQVSLSHVEFMSIQARLLNYVLQTFRHRNFILFMTSPHFNFINATARKLFHSRMETVSIDVEKKLCVLKPLLLQTNQRKGDIYQKYLRVYHKDYGVSPLKRIKVGMPSPELIEAYEKKKDNFTSELNKNIGKDLDKLEGKEVKEKKPLTEKQSNILEDLMDGLVASDISQKRSIHEKVVKFHIKQIQKKGIRIIPVKEKSKIIRYDVIENEQ